MQKPPLAGMEHDSTGKPPQYPIESVDNALRLLLLLGERSEIRLTDASEYLRVASSTAHRLLSMLQYRGFVRQDPASKAYQPGPSLTNVAFAVHSRMDIPRTAAPILRQLVDTLQETVHVGTLDGRLVRFIAALESPSAVRVISRLGSTRPAHCTSTGKVLLAGLSDDELDQLYPDPHLEPLTEHSVRTLTELRAQLAEVRKSGFAISRQESEEGVASVAVAVPQSGSGIRLALNASAPSYRFRPSDVRKACSALTDAAAELARNLGS
ncbi:IclR family transcriptional regulator [Mycolicibacterium monacense]|nr:IclR family transcriptional regulator [Mycolicibacterium monacense]ORB11492.1 IclR family transcriptional regulator [Mycolicibacterium monacense DSM 44395]QHP85369.1 IclR family transcriptional regulator [Mycolicibacterium monacense DSM 44395]